jgi:perosamine synthetase
MFVTNDDDLYEHVLTLSNHGRSRHQKKQFWPDMVGFKYKMSNIQAAIGCAQMERIEQLIARKQEIMKSYKDRLEVLPGIALNPEPEETVNGAWMPTVVFKAGYMITREELLENFLSNGIDARVFFWPLSSINLFGGRANTPVANSIPLRAINLPSFHDMSESEQCRVIDVILTLLANRHLG